MNSRVHPLRQVGWHWFIVIIAFIGLAWGALGSSCYYRWALGERRIDVHVFCETSELMSADMKAFALYDKVALNPLARALGVLQNRDPGDVRDFLFVPAENVEITPVSARLKSVPYGPLSRVLFVTGHGKFHVDVKDRRLLGDTIYVRVSGEPLIFPSAVPDE